MTLRDEQSSLVSFAIEPGEMRIQDELEGESLRIETTDRTEVRTALTDLFVFPVDDALSFRASALRVGPHASAYLRDEGGEHLGEFTATPRKLPEGTYFIELTGTVKSYVRVSGAGFTARYPHRDDSYAPLDISFDGQAEVAVGARSFHERPQATITVPDDPRATMEAVSYLGSSIKEFSAERSWPSLRGHPPAIRRGEELDVPSTLSKPETGVTIAVPPTYADVYRVAPLAFYLGASVEPGDAPELRLENGYVETLGTGSRSLERSVDRLLGTCILLDSLTRVGGYYSFPRYEYEELAPELPFYPPNLYDLPISEQLMEYLEVPPSQVEPYVPRWPTTAVLRPGPSDAELLPYLLDTLSPIRVVDSPPDAEPSASVPKPGLLRAYTHENPPANSGRLLRASFENALSCNNSNSQEASFAFVTDDESRASQLRALSDEQADWNGSAGPLLDAVDVVERPSRDELRRRLEASYDFLYCELPAFDGGFACADGVLDSSAVDDVGARGVGIGGHSSLEPAVELVDSGAVVGVVTEQVPSPCRIDRAARLLAAGHSLVESVLLAGVDSETTYRFVGDAARVLIRREGGNILGLVNIESVSPDEHDLTLWTLPTEQNALGGVVRFDDFYAPDEYQLYGREHDRRVRLATEEVVSLIENEDTIVRFNGRTQFDLEGSSEALVRDVARRELRESR